MHNDNNVATISQKPIRVLQVTGLLLASLLGINISFASEINCQFTPTLTCSDTSGILWQDQRFTEARQIATSPSHLYISKDHTVYSFELNTGKPSWHHSAIHNADYFYPVYSNEALYLAQSNGALEKRDGLTGALIWSTKLSQGWVYPPTIIDHYLFTGGQDQLLLKINTDNGKVEKQVQLNQELVTPLFTIGRTLIASTFDAKLTAYEPNLVQPIWQKKLTAAAFSLQQHKNKIIAADMGGNIQAISATDGETLWKRTPYLNARYWTLIHKQTLLSVNHQGEFYANNINTGKQLNHLSLNRDITQAPIAQQDFILLFDHKGNKEQIMLTELNQDLTASF